MKLLHILFRILTTLLALLFIGLGLARLILEIYASTRIYTLQDLPQGPVAIVFGAGLYRDGSPTPVLRDRVATAAQLYFSGKVQKLLMSGDNRFEYYNEPGAMKIYAMQLGVPEADIILDYAGRRTYDTCYRARSIFGVQEAVLVTQRFHLPRAVFTCNEVGVSAWGVAADLRPYQRRSRLVWALREWLASPVALWDVWISHPTPVLGDPEPIFPPEQANLP